MNRVLFVQTYDYLSEPIISKYLKENNVKDYRILFINDKKYSFKKINSDFEVDEVKNFGFLHYRAFSNNLFKYIDEICPTKIITFSDTTLFARAIQGSDYESILTIIQPCLLSYKFTFRLFIRCLCGLVLNKIMNISYFQTKMYWGQLLKNATYQLWFEYEPLAKVINAKKQFIGYRYIRELKVTENASSKNILVIAPDFSFYSKNQKEEYENELNKILIDDQLIFVKYHPNSNFRLSSKNYSIYNDSPLEVKCVICSFTNLYLSIRKNCKRVIMYDIGDYVDTKSVYLQDLISKRVEHLEKGICL